MGMHFPRYDLLMLIVRFGFYSDGAPHAWVDLRNLSPYQPYDVSLQVVVPATEANYALGNFMTTLSINTLSNKTIASVRRPVRLPFVA